MAENIDQYHKQPLPTEGELAQRKAAAAVAEVEAAAKHDAMLKASREQPWRDEKARALALFVDSGGTPADFETQEWPHMRREMIMRQLQQNKLAARRFYQERF